MSQHDTLTLREALRSIQYEAASLADAQVIALQALNATYPARAALSATQPAQAAQSVPGVNKAVQLIPGMTKEQFAYVHHCALEVDAAKAETARLLAENAALKAQAAQGEPAEHWHRLYLEKCQQYNDRVAQLGGVIEGLEAEAAQGAGEVVVGIIAEWRDVILNARHNMDGVLDNDQINEVLNVWDDMAIEVERALGAAMPSNAQAQLRAVEKLIDGSQPIDIPGALAVIRHGGTTPPPAQQPEAVPSEQSGWCVYVAGMVAGWLGMDVDDPKIPTMGAIIERRLWALKRDTPPAQAAADARDAERYRYLRNRVPSEVLGQLKRAAGCWIDCEDDDGVLTLLTGHDADAAIDAAIAASKKGPQ